jgi:CRP/FNR family transcriptional regulator, cyclic AMP receptor protein
MLTSSSSQIDEACAADPLPGRLPRMDATMAAKLRAIPIFADLDDNALARVGAVVTEFEAPAGHVLTQPGQEGSGMFVLEEGSVAVEIPRGGTVTLGPGEFFGELAILAEGITRTARVQATTTVRCLAVARRDFAAILEAEPDIAVAMLPVLAKRIASLETA